MVPTRPLSALLVAATAAALLTSAQLPAAAAATSVQVYWSSESRTAGYEPKNGNWYTSPATGLAGTPYQLSRQADAPIVAASGSATVTVDTATKYQSILGIGSSLEESTIYNLSRMSATGRDKALRTLVDPATGAGFNVARITFGTSDFTSHDFYTYDDGAADPSLSRFSIQRDIDYNIITTLKQALAINPNLRIFASAWSAPPWMKTSNNIIGGSLNSTYIPTLATYYRRAVQAYVAQGIPIYALTLQNEPLFSPADYPGMLVSADQERQLAKALRTELSNNALGGVKIWAFDHNFSEGVSYAAGVLGSSSSHSDAYSSVDGIAFHDYAGDPSAMSTVKASYPDKDVLMTERSVWGTSGADRIVQYFRNNSTLYEGWVSMLDQNRSPERWSGSPDPTMLVQSPTNRDTFWALPDYNMVAQFSKFVAAGARRVSTGYGSTGTVTNVAFQNPDGTLVTVVVNQTGASQPFTLRVGNQQISNTLPAKTVGTYLWAGADSGTPSTRTGQITGYGSKCVDVAGASSANGTKIQLYTCNGSTAQQWTVGTDGTLRALGKCLDVAAASSANGTKVQLYDCNGTAAQQWVAGTDGSLQSLGKCLDATGPSSADGTQLQIWACSGAANQRWTLP
ncbi:ricin-type beta-trefoil lectin domain protein [Dactylosporangium sp. NPDC051485]|uniref:ricin-type beta-trefoil lectin domain protein n=1 Tax=Dactylosporangium sp. NPDC051485 TaxID=3154846 RepID=UPI0034243E01